VNVPVPNATSICLNISRRCWLESRAIRKQSGIDSSRKNTVAFEEEEFAIDYLELVMQSVVFAFTALEAFANEMITADYIYKKKGNKCIENYNKTEIERWLSIDEKYDKILPLALSVKSPKGNHRAWSDLLKLKEVRDRLIHMKSDDRRSSGPEKKTIWSELMTSEPPYREAFTIISYFIEKIESKPRWYELGRSKLSK
jgi:hypothetical protein